MRSCMSDRGEQYILPRVFFQTQPVQLLPFAILPKPVRFEKIFQVSLVILEFTLCFAKGSLSIGK